MVEKFKEQIKKSFSNGPKAKIMVGLVAFAFVLTMTVVIMRKTVSISIDGKEETFVTYKGTVNDVLEDQGIELDSKDRVQPSLEAKVSENEKINIKKAVPVKVVIAGQELELKTAEDTIGDMLLAEADTLKEKGVDYKEEDIVTPAVDTPIASSMDVNVVQVQIEELVETQEIPYGTVSTVDYSKDFSEQQVTRQGVNGEKEVTYKVVKHDGVVVKKEEISQKPIKAAQDKLVVKGGSAVIASRGADPIIGKKRLYMQSTAYSGHGTTATGRKPVYNPSGLSTIAVDPRVIPLGSKVFVRGYGYAIAADTGGAIKGNIIDVYFNSSSQCRSWGRKYGVEVLLIAYPGEW